MANYYEAVTATEYEKDGEKRSRFNRVGVLFPMKNKPGFKLVLDGPVVLIPGTNDLLFMEPKPKDGAKSGGQKDDIAF